MAAPENITFAFDLDGTIANYGQEVTPKVAKSLNKLGHIHIISGAPLMSMRSATSQLTDKSLHSIRECPGNKSIDLSLIMNVKKNHFHKSQTYQSIRKKLCLELRRSFHTEIFVGGRSTLDIMPIKNKAHVIRHLQSNGKKVIYFYDCKWAMNDEIHNDIPAVKEAWKSIRTTYDTITTDLATCLKTITS